MPKNIVLPRATGSVTSSPAVHLPLSFSSWLCFPVLRVRMTNTNSSPKKCTFVPSTQHWAPLRELETWPQGKTEAGASATQRPGKHLSILTSRIHLWPFKSESLGVGPKTQALKKNSSSVSNEKPRSRAIRPQRKTPPSSGTQRHMLFDAMQASEKLQDPSPPPAPSTWRNRPSRYAIL